MDGRSRRVGLEVGTELTAAAGLRVRVSGALSRNKHEKYENDLGDFDGKFAAGIPGRSVNATLRWEPAAGFFAEAAARHCGPYYADDANEMRVPAWTICDASVGARLRVAGIQGDVSLSVRNLGDRLYTESVWVNALTAGGGARYSEPGLPRNVVASLTLRSG
jgi:iron complex outermembrane recepter protein